MSTHGLRRVVLGVPDLAASGRFYEDFGLTRTRDHVFASTDGGLTWTNASRQLPRGNQNGVLSFDASTGTLYAATFDLGLYVFLPRPGGPLAAGERN